MNRIPLTRRRFLGILPAPVAALLVAACGGDEDNIEPSSGGANGDLAPGTDTATDRQPGAVTTAQASLPQTPACGDDDGPTVAQTEGPYFTPNSPERASLIEPGITGTKLILEGFVLTTGCQPISRALVDFWQCDDAGSYDNRGYRLRGHQFTDAAGKYRLETIVPALYPGRTRHIHVKVQAPDRPVLTTQLYFPNDAAANRRDGIFNEALVLETYRDDAGGKAGSFDFVLRV